MPRKPWIPVGIFHIYTHFKHTLVTHFDNRSGISADQADNAVCCIPRSQLICFLHQLYLDMYYISFYANLWFCANSSFYFAKASIIFQPTLSESIFPDIRQTTDL